MCCRHRYRSYIGKLIFAYHAYKDIVRSSSSLTKAKSIIVSEEFLYNFQAIKRKAAFKYTGRDTVT